MIERSARFPRKRIDICPVAGLESARNVAAPRAHSAGEKLHGIAIGRRHGAPPILAAARFARLIAGCGDDSVTPESITKPAFVGTDHQDVLRRRERRPADRRPRQDRARAAPRRRSRIRAAPTAAELRTLAIYNNYRAIVDITANGGYGTLYGPNVDVNGNDTLGEGKIAGTEYIAYADDGSGSKNVTMMVQVPASFNPRPRLHRHGDVVRLARRLRRDRQRRRMGPEARLRGRLHRQGHRHRRARPRDQHGQPAERHAHRRRGRGHERRTSPPR